MMNHESVKDRLVRLVLEELSGPERTEVLAHLATCEECRVQRERLETVLRCAGRRQDLSVTLPTLASARHRLMAAVNDERESDTARSPMGRALKGRRLMTSPIVKLGIAAGITVVVGLFGLSRLAPPDKNGALPQLNLLARACAAEESLFQGTKIVHIQNEIIVYAGSSNPAAEEPNFVWLPMCSVQPDGHLQVNQLKLAVAPESYVVTDHSWYDPATGRFSRILKAGDAVVFANSYDGQCVYDTTVTPEGMLQTVPQPVADGFRPPASPAAYLGLAPGLKTALDPNSSSVQSVERGTLHGGEPAHIYKAGTPDPNGQMNSYCLFKVRDEDSTLAEEEFVGAGRPQLLMRRVLTETPETPAVSWNLREVEGTGAAAPQRISITPDMVIPRVSVEHMVERAKFETYVFSTKPAWTGPVEITDIMDPASAGARAFSMEARADDGRHLVLVQAPTYNRMLGRRMKQSGILVYTSPNGFKVWGGGPQKWYSGILLRGARATIKDPPSENRIGYVLESPAGTFPALAVNGPISDDALHGLVDSLVPARDYLKNHPPAAPKAQP
jgi:hypothetical protein